MLLPPSPPKTRIKTTTEGDQVLAIRAVADRMPPMMVAHRQPKQFMMTLATGPTNTNKSIIITNTTIVARAVKFKKIYPGTC